MPDDLTDFFLADEAALDALGDVRVAGQQEHVALPHELLRTRLIEDDAAVGEAADGERHAGRNVGLDHAGDHVHAGPLRGDDEVDPHRTRLLRNPGDALFDIASGHHHQVVELVDDDDDVLHPLRAFRRLTIRSNLGAGLGLQLAAIEGGVVAGDVAEPDLEQHVVAAVHLLACPLQRVGRLLRVGDRLGEQVGQLVVLAHLNLLGIDQDQLHLVRRGAHQQRRDDAVDAARLPCSGGAGDEEVRGGGQVEVHRSTGNVLADRDIERVRRRLGLGRGHDVAERDELPGVVRHLHPDRRAPGDGRQDAHVDGGHGVRDVAVERGDTRDLHTAAELQFVARDRGADRHPDELDLDAVGVQRLHQRAAPRFDLCLVDGLHTGTVEERLRGQRPLASLGPGAEIELRLLTARQQWVWCSERGRLLAPRHLHRRRLALDFLGLHVVDLGRGSQL